MKCRRTHRGAASNDEDNGEVVKVLAIVQQLF